MKTGKYFIIVIMFMTAIILSCNNDEIILNEGDYIVFGHYYGMCVGDNCVRNYKLTNNSLYEDINHSYAGNTDFDFVELSENKFEMVRHLPGLIPAELLQSDGGSFGCPDCADQGGLLVLIHKNGKTRTWHIDQQQSAIPEYLHSFADTVNECIESISE